MEKENFRKINDYLWEIPKNFRSDMRVPARIYLSEKMLGQAFRDKSIDQLINVATLPGIVNYSIAMPDMHEGYGFCLHPKTKVMSNFGFYSFIKDFQKNWKDKSIKVVDFQSRNVEETNIKRFIKFKPKNKIFKIYTKAGHKIIATEDHPFYTKRGMIELKELKVGDLVGVFPFEGAPYKKPPKGIIINEKDIEKVLIGTGIQKNSQRFNIIFKKLKVRNLLPLTYNHPKLPYLLKIMGFLYGDGSMNFIGKRRDGILSFSGKKENLEIAREDIKKIGYTPSRIYSKKQIIPYKGKKRTYVSSWFYVNASSLLVLFEALGVPKGGKTFQSYRLPKWLFKSPLWQKRLFLASFFGSELRIPHRRKGRGTMFDSPVLAMSKGEDLLSNGRLFLKDLIKLLKEFDVEIAYINQRRRYINSKGKVSWTLELIFSSKLKSLINLWSKIGFEYNKKRSFLANVAVQYLKIKHQILWEKEEAIKFKIPQLLKSGLSYQKIAAQLAGNPLTKRFIIDVCWKLNKGVKNIRPQVPHRFPTFQEYFKKATQGLGKSGIVWDEIVKIEELSYKGYVYDFTVNHSDHNFIANNFVVSNCIGGVAAMNAENGVISPGGVGFDINCLHPDSIINLDFGTHLPIKDFFEKFSNFNLPLIEKKSKQLIISKPIRFLWRLENQFLYNIKTKTGYSIKVTGDHPLYTKKGMKKAENLKIGEQLILYPFKGVPFEEPKNLILITKKRIIKALKELNLANNGNRWVQIIKWFKGKNLIDLNLCSWQMPYLAKVVGYLFGDGTVNLIGKQKKGVISFYGKLEDLEQIKKDLEKINVHSKIFTRKRHHKIKNFYQKEYEFFTIEHCLRINSTAFTLLLYLLGVPLGNKTYQEFRIPFWLWQAPKWYKRLFLAAFFGAELSKPAVLNKYNFYAPTLNINKVVLFKNNGVTFLKEIKKLLKEFDIDTTRIVELDKLGNRGKTIGLRFQINSSSNNLIRFFETIGFEYHREKQKLSCLAAAYLRQKLLVVESRKRVRELVRSLYSEGVRVKDMVRDYSNDFIGQRFIEHSVWSGRGEPRIAFNFMSFEDFVKTNSYGDFGFVIDEVEEIIKEDYKGLVYDFTINNPNHNFIANNFVVSNCGMRLLKSEYSKKDLEPYLEKLAEEIQKEVPSGLGRGRQMKLDFATLDKILEGGAKKLVEQGYGENEDIENCEANGCLEQADTSVVSSHAKNRGRDQVGTLGSGNHFLEIQIVDEVFNEEVAKAFGLFKDQIVIMIHTGSRGLGHQIATDYIRVMMRAMSKYQIKVPDRQLAACPFNSPEGQRYFSAMSAGANYAWANRQMIAYYVRKAWKKVLGEKASKLISVYDVAHNIAKLETHKIEDKEMSLIVHRKGATRAFPPGHSEIPEKYRNVGQPVLIPGSMGTASYVLVGTEKGKESWFSTCHGAGRTMSRKAATRTLSGQDVIRSLDKKGIIVKCYSMRGIAEEAPQAYKNIDEVVEVVHQAGLSKKVARLKPLAVIKGE